MGFSIPSLSLPSLGDIDINSAISSLTETFDPSKSVGAVSDNIAKQLEQAESMRSELESIRQQAQAASSAIDFQALQEYTAGLQSSTDVSCIMSSAKPSFVPMTPDSITNPLASADTKGLVTDALGAYTGIDSDIIDAAMSGDIDTLTSPDTLTDLAISGAGVYVSGLTGGAISPSMASTCIDAVAGDTVKGAISSTLSGELSVSSLTSSLPTSTSNDILSAISLDQSGSLMESTLAQSISKSMDSISSNKISSLTTTDLSNIANQLTSNLNIDDSTKLFGGVNLSDPTATIVGLGCAGLDSCIKTGDIDGITNYADQLLENIPAQTLLDQVTTSVGSIVPTQGNIDKFTELYNKISSYIQEPAQIMNDAGLQKERDALVSAMANRNPGQELANLSVTVIKQPDTSTMESAAINATKYQGVYEVYTPVSTLNSRSDFTTTTWYVHQVASDLWKEVTFQAGSILSESIVALQRDVFSVLDIERRDEVLRNERDFTDVLISTGSRLAKDVCGDLLVKEFNALQKTITQLQNAI